MLSGIGDIDFQYVPINVRSNEWLFTITTNRMEELLEYLNKNNVMSMPFWVPMNQLPMYKDKIYITKSDVSSSVHKKALSIPCSTGIQMSQLETVVKTIKDFYKGG
jgi:perosamine synthetase